MRAFRAPTMTALHDQLCEALIHSPVEKIDVVSSVDVQIHNVIAEAKSMEWDFDMKNMWLTPSRWSMMAKQYIDPEELEKWIGQCTGKIGKKGRGIAVMRTREVKPRGGAATGHTNKETRRWGACMLAISYKARPKPQITLYSRTSYLGYIGALDLTVAWMCARYLAKEMGMDVKEFSFVWMNEAVQWHYFKSLAYMLNHHDEEKQDSYRRLLIEPSANLASSEKRIILDSPGIRGSRKWLQKVIQEDNEGRTYGDMSYNTFRRIVRRYHTEVFGYEHAQQFEGWSYYKKGPQLGEQKEYFRAYKPLPNTLATSLDFSKIGMPLSRSYGEPFVESNETEDEDDE